jgi:hypothetical protein
MPSMVMAQKFLWIMLNKDVDAVEGNYKDWGQN